MKSATLAIVIAVVLVFGSVAQAVAAPPTATTGAATNVTYKDATVAGTVDPNEEETGYQIQYGLTTSYGLETFENFAGDGADPVPVQEFLSGLSASTTYHYRVVATRGGIAVAFGVDQTFTTSAAPPPPAVTTTAATGVTYRAADLNGTIDPGGFDASYYFEYGETTAYGSLTSELVIGPSPGPQPIAIPVANLQAETTYHFRLVGLRDGVPVSFGADQQFTTQGAPPPPVVATTAATAVGKVRATLNGTVDPNGTDTTWHFEYGPETTYGQTAGFEQIDGSEPGGPVSSIVTNLLPGTTYHYRIVATRFNEVVATGADQQFTTQPRDTALMLGQAMALNPGWITGAAFITEPPQNVPNGVSTTAGKGYPTDGPSYALMSSGAAEIALDPSANASSGDGGSSIRGDTDRDVSILRLDLAVPAGANCLSFDLRFFSEEYPTYVGSSYNDAFIAELDTSTWTTSGSTITAPNNFAFDPSNDVLSINSTGATSMSAENAAGTPYGGGTAPLKASTAITPGAHSLYLSIFDQGDTALDSIVFLDRLVLGTTAPGGCTSGASGDLTPPVVTLTSPANGSSSADTTPTFGGTAGTAPGDLAQITVKVYAGPTATGTPVQTITTDAVGGIWSVDATSALPPGEYTAIAQQSDTAANVGTSNANTFTIVAPGVTVSVGDVTVTEGNSGEVNASFPVSLSGPSAGSVSVDLATSDGTATSPADFTAATSTVSFEPGQTAKTIDVKVKGDLIDEIDETFSATLSNAVGATVADGSATGTITDDDAPPTLSIADIAKTEGNSGSSAATFTVSLSQASGKTVSVDYAAAAGSATIPADLAAASGTLTFAPGQTSRTLDVMVVGDTLDEPDETFSVGLTNAANASLSDGSATGTINDDDGPPALSITDTTVTEGDTGQVSATLTVSLSTASGKTVTVDHATVAGTATAGADYTAGSGALTFDPGQTSKTVTVAVLGDTVDEVDETFTVALSNAANASVADASGTITIDDDDGPAFSIADVTVSEGTGGTVTASFTISLSAASPHTTSVSFASANGSALAGPDYASELGASGSVFFGPGETSKELNILVHGDALDEPDETFTVAISSPVNATIDDGSATGTITDDDDPPALSITDTTVIEGNSGTTAATLTVSLSAASGKTITVDHATVAGSASAGSDFTDGSGTLSFDPGQTSKTLTVDVLGDSADEIDEALSVALSGAVNATVADASGAISIDDDDGPAISVSDVTATEGTGTGGTATFTVSLSAASPQPVSVSFATANGSASAPADYASASGTLTFAPGETSKTVSVVLQGDSADEPNETFSLGLSGASESSIGDATGTGTITDDDAPDQPPPSDDAIDTSDLPGSLKIGAVCPGGKKKTGRFTGEVDFEQAGRATFDLIAEFRRTKGKRTTTTRFRLGKITRRVRAGEVEFTISINRGRCKRLRRELDRAGSAGGTLVLTIKQRTNAGDNEVATKRIAIKKQ